MTAAPVSFPTRPARVEEIEQARPAVTETKVDPLPHIWASAIANTFVAEEIIEGVLTRGTMSVVYGESGCGKTYLVLDLACRVALGLPWLGRRTHRGLVIYIAAEAGKSIQNRVLAFKTEHGIEDLPMALVTIPVDLRDPMCDRDRVIELAREIAEVHGEPVVLIVVDTLARAFAGGNENASEDMGSLVANSDRIREKTGAHVLWIHHCGKNSALGARGHSLLRASTDTEIEVSNRDGSVIARFTKQRDGPPGDELAADLRAVVIGENAWGNPLTACVVDGLVDAPAPRKAERKLPSGCEMSLRALKEAIGERGQTLPGTSAIPPGVKAVTGTCWRDRYYLLVAIVADSKDAAEINKAKEARKKQFTRTRDALLERGLVGSINDLHWLQ